MARILILLEVNSLRGRDMELKIPRERCNCMVSRSGNWQGSHAERAIGVNKFRRIAQQK